MRFWAIGAMALCVSMPSAAHAARDLLVFNATGELKGFTTPGLTQTHDFFPFGVASGLDLGSVGAFTNGDGRTDLVVGSGAGGPSVVRVYDTASGLKTHEFTPFDAGYKGGIRVAAGDVNGDGRADIAVAAAGGGPKVKVFDGLTGAEIRAFDAFDPMFTGGVSVALGRTDEGRATIIVGAGAGGAPQVKVFDFETHALLHSFFAFAPTFSGGVNVAYGHLGGLNTLIVGQASGGSNVKIFGLNARGDLLEDFNAFDPGFTGGVNVAGGSFGRFDGVFVAGDGSVRVLEANRQSVLANFRPFDGGGPLAIAATFNPVPEPATWALMIGGFALAGGMLRRRRAVVPL
jgi:hypothetical protein